MKTQKLTDFTCQPHYPYTLFLGKSVETGTNLNGILKPIPIKVPQSIYSALEREGIIENVFYDMNSLKAEWASERWWLYETEFRKEDFKNSELVFESVDYKCHIYLNNEKVYEHTGASFGFSVDISTKIQDYNYLRILVENIPNEYGQIGYTNKTSTQRPRFDYKWDFCTRLKNIGIYRPIYLNCYNGAKVNNVSFRTLDYQAKKCKISLFVNAKKKTNYDICVSIIDKERNEEIYNFCENKLLNKSKNQIDFTKQLSKLDLWYPNGIGEPKTYLLRVGIYKDGCLCDELSQIIGVREIKLEKNAGVDFDCLNYTFCVNGKRFFLKGFNITPLKQTLGDEKEEDYIRIVEQAKKANANLIRVWGGGVIEQPIFYELCSKNGLMVWQDMIQSSSGLNSEPSVSKKFLSLLEKTVRFTLENRSQYPCFAVICGGNELFGADWKPVTMDNKNIQLIYNIKNEYAPELEFIPSTSSGPTQEADMEDFRNNHDVHGPWLYLGNDNHFSYYNKRKALFVGEFGCNGMCSLNSIDNFLSRENQIVTSSVENDLWRHHGEW